MEESEGAFENNIIQAKLVVDLNNFQKVKGEVKGEGKNRKGKGCDEGKGKGKG